MCIYQVGQALAVFLSLYRQALLLLKIIALLAHREVAEGVIVEEGAVLSMGVIWAPQLKSLIAQREIFYGRVPPYSWLDQ